MADDHWPEVVSNLRKERQKWAQLTGMLGREGVDARTSGQIYLAVLQLVMLYRSATWVVIPLIGRILGEFLQRVARRLTGRQPH